jgi:protein-S-isoprenylcysteine O-methyltransferase Ste14
MENEQRGPLPPVLLLLAIVAMAALDTLLPVADIVEGRWRLLGLLPAAAGIGLNVWSSRLFERHGTTIKTAATSTTLVVDGPFRYSRNPMYLGMVLLLMGLALVLGSLTPWFVLPVFIALIQYEFILMEERKMAGEFGAQYAEYRRRVRRWL